MMSSDGCSRVVVLLMLVVAMAATLVALVTDYWYDVEVEGLVSTRERKENTFRFGLLRRCYMSRPEPFPILDVDYSGSDCIWIYRDLIPEDEGKLSSDEKARIHLMRSALGLSITAAAFCLFAILTLMFAFIPGACRTPQKTSTYFITLILVMVACIAAIASGICFMAARDVEDKDLDMYPKMNTKYLWSFMLHWCGAGIMFLIGCHMLYLLARSYNTITNKNYYYSY